MDTGGRIIDCKLHRADITSISVTSDGQFLLISSVDGAAILWDTASGDVVMRYGGDCGKLSSAAFTRKERIIVAGSSDGTVYFWDRTSSELLARLHCLDEGFLWSAPADEAAASGWFFTDRPDVIHVIKCRDDGSEPEVLAADDPERSVHLKLYNRKEMVVGKLNDPEKYQREVERIVGGVQASLLESYGERLKNRQIGHKNWEE
jgi:WD40 repeat protein